MTPTAMAALLQHLRKVSNPSAAANVSDAELLERFVRCRDEAAFELLVWRHQRLVSGVCRRVLADVHDAEDAFQATFLALARKAAAVGRGDAVASWLHTVAFRIALRARAAAQRMKTNVDLVAVESRADPIGDVARRDLAAVLDEEIGRLPRKYRVPVVLCYLEGKTYAEAARQLGMAAGTLAGRLMRARELLRRRLIRRGISISGTFLAVVLGEQASLSAAPAALVNTAVKAAAAGASSTAVAALTEGALRSMVISKVKTGMIALLSGLLVTGMGLFVPAAPLFHLAAPAEPPCLSTTTTASKEKPSHVDREGEPLPPGALLRFGSVKLRHFNDIRNSALSADGKFLATASSHCVIVWDLTTQKRLWCFRGEEKEAFDAPGIAFSPDGKYLGYVHNSDLAYLWSTADGREIARFCGRGRHRQAICQFTPDGRFVLDDENHLLYWEPQKAKGTQSKPIEHINLLSPDGKTWGFADERSTIRFGEVQTGQETSRLPLVAANNGMVNGVAFSPDGKALAVVHQHKEIQIHDFPGGKLRASFPVPASPHSNRLSIEPLQYRVSFSSDGKMLLLGTYYGTIHRWELNTGKTLPALKGHIRAAAGIHTMSDGRTLLTTGADGLIYRWDSQTGRELTEPSGYAGRICMAYSPDARLVAVGDERGRLDLWDAHSGQLLRVFQRNGPAIHGLTFAPDSKSLAEARRAESPSDKLVQFWDVASAVKQRALPADPGSGGTLMFSPDGGRLLVGNCQFPRLYELSTGKVCWRVDYYFGPNVFSRDGKTLYVASGPYLNFLDAASGKTRSHIRLNNAPEHLGIVASMALSLDGQRLALGLHSGEVLLCDAANGSELMRIQAVELPKKKNAPLIKGRRNQDAVWSAVWGVAFSPDGKWLATAATDGGVRLWEAATGRLVLRLTGHEGYAHEIFFGADGRTLLTDGQDAQAYLWSLRPPMEQGTSPSLGSLWADLADEPAKAYRAVWTMSETKDAIAFLRGKLVPAKPVANERIRKQIADLESDHFAVRERATKVLADLDTVAAPAMREALRNKPPLETRKRLEEILRRIETKALSADELRIVRAISVLERQGTLEARELLQTLKNYGLRGAPR